MSFEAQAFLEAVQFFRQEKGHYGSWEMMTGNEIQILSNLVMEELLPSLQSMVLPKMKGKRNDRKRAWFGILEDTYHLVQEQVSEGLRSLKEECKEVTTGLEGTIRSNMDQIVTSKNHLVGKIKESISEPIQICCGESIQPFLASILEELMGPVSSGFSEVRLLFEKEVNEISQNFQSTKDTAKLKENVNYLTSLPYNSVKMEPCYLKVNLLQEHLQDLNSRFKFHNIGLVIQRTQNVMQELMENAVYTFEQLLGLSHDRDMAKMSTAIEKVKLRVLKQYDYDSSTARKKIFQDALVQISLPTLQRTLASTCKPELQKYEQFIFAEHNNVIQVENVYEEILLQTLLDEALKVIKEAAHLKKHNLYEEMNLPSESVSSLSDLKTPSGSAQASPARKPSTNLEILATDTQSNEVFTPEKMAQDGCHEATKVLGNKEGFSAPASSIATEAREEGTVSDLGGNWESPSVILGAADEKRIPQLPIVVETSLGGSAGTLNKEPVEEEKLPVTDGVNEIRKLLTLIVELPADVPSEKNEQVVHECGVIKPQEYAEETDKEDKMNTKECQTCEMHEPSEVPFPLSIEAADINKAGISFLPIVEADYINVTGICGEGGNITHMDPFKLPEELGLCQTSRAESETKTSIWYTDVKSGSPDHQSQTKPSVESGQSGQTEEGLSPFHFVPIDENSQLEQHAESRKLNLGKEEFPSLQSVPVDDNSQTWQYVEDSRSDLQRAGHSPPHLVLTEVDAAFFRGCPDETQESILNIANLAIEPIDRPVSSTVKETEGSNLGESVHLDSKNFTFAQRDEFKQAGVTLPSADVGNTTGETDRWENAEGSCPESQSEK
ncbi:protein Niban 1 isoform X2 [Rhineura floridana]|nr:protein Niban 1 isoform X2 [Rhineura floridana]